MKQSLTSRLTSRLIQYLVVIVILRVGRGATVGDGAMGGSAHAAAADGVGEAARAGAAVAVSVAVTERGVVLVEPLLGL
jgi:hypothetical protein